MEDLINLPTVTSTAVADALRRRAEAADGGVYTRCGPLLVALNPFRAVPLYGAAQLTKYVEAADPTALPPHVFALGAVAVGALRQTGRSQSVIVSGESGAGKTESVKFLLQFLSHACRPEHAGRAELHLRLNEANPVLEAFGCARTVFNDNSSRFGKFVAVRLDASAQLASAHVRTYLLEKSRLVARSAGECSFHVVHQLLGAASGDVARLLRGWPREASGWHYLRGAGERDTAADAQRFKELLRALHAVGVRNAARTELFDALGALLHLGEVRFVARGGGDGGGGSGDDGAEQTEVVEEGGALAAAAEALGCEYDELRDALCFRCIKAGTEWVKAHNSPAAARDVRDGFAKALYSALFSWVVARINRSLRGAAADGAAAAGDDDDDDEADAAEAAAAGEAAGGGRRIGLLDIFGFENLARNSLEQLCINFTNEKLQQLFVREMLEATTKVYEAEGVPFEGDADSPPRDDACVALIDNPHHGVFALLSRECRLPGGSDQKLLDALFEAHAAHPKFARAKARARLSRATSRLDYQTAAAAFTVAHYAGDVSYDVDGFVLKNRDPVSRDLLILMRWSRRRLLSSLFSTSAAGAPEGSRFAGLAERFAASLHALLATIRRDDTHFVRCVKPNDRQAAGDIDGACLQRQIDASGLVAAVRVCRVGFTDHLPIAMVVTLYGGDERVAAHGLAAGAEVAVAVGEAERAAAVAVLARCGVSESEFRLGRTKVFLRRGALEILEASRRATLNRPATVVQRHARGRRARVAYVARKAAAAQQQQQKEAEAAAAAEAAAERMVGAEAAAARREAEEKAEAEAAAAGGGGGGRGGRTIAKRDSFSRRIRMREKIDLGEKTNERLIRASSFERRRKVFGESVKRRSNVPAVARLQGAGPPSAAMSPAVGPSPAGERPPEKGGGRMHFARRAEAAEGGSAEEAAPAVDLLDRLRAAEASSELLRRAGDAGADQAASAAEEPKAEEEEEEEEAEGEAEAIDEAPLEWTPPLDYGDDGGGPVSPGGGKATAAAEEAAVAEAAPAVVAALKWPLEYVLEYARYIGFRLPKDAPLLWIADSALGEGDSPEWEQCLDPRGGLYYEHKHTHTTLSQHPVDYHYQHFYLLLRQQRALAAAALTARAAPRSPEAKAVEAARDRAEGLASRQQIPRSFRVHRMRLSVARSAPHGLGLQVNGTNVVMGFASAAAAATGLQLGDRIVKIDGTSLANGLLLSEVLTPKPTHAMVIERWVPEFEADELAEAGLTPDDDGRWPMQLPTPLAAKAAAAAKEATKAAVKAMVAAEAAAREAAAPVPPQPAAARSDAAPHRQRAAAAAPASTDTPLPPRRATFGVAAASDSLEPPPSTAEPPLSRTKSSFGGLRRSRSLSAASFGSGRLTKALSFSAKRLVGGGSRSGNEMYAAADDDGAPRPAVSCEGATRRRLPFNQSPAPPPPRARSFMVRASPRRTPQLGRKSFTE